MSENKRSQAPNPRNAYPSEDNDRLAAEALILSEQGKTDAEIAHILRIDAASVPRFLTLIEIYLASVGKNKFIYFLR